MLEFVIIAFLGFCMSSSILAQIATIPERFIKHSREVNISQAAFECSYNDSVCQYRFNFDTNVNWTAVVNGEEVVLNGTGSISESGPLDTVWVTSESVVGTKCLFFSAYTTTHDISWTVSINNHHTETVTPLPANRNLVKKITVGLSNKPYKIAFHIYSFVDDARPKFGEAYIGKLALVDGPCSEHTPAAEPLLQNLTKCVVSDLPSLNCNFDMDFCEWSNAGSKYVWHHVPFGLHHSIPRAIKFGALAAFAGKGALFSPVVQPDGSRCFSFNYAKGEGKKTYLRVWLVYRIPFSKDVKSLLYEDVSERKLLKKRVHINIFTPFNFQIAFEGRSKTILHGVIVLHTAITDFGCPETGECMNLKPDVLDLPKPDKSTATP